MRHKKSVSVKCLLKLSPCELWLLYSYTVISHLLECLVINRIGLINGLIRDVIMVIAETIIVIIVSGDSRRAERWKVNVHI